MSRRHAREKALQSLYQIDLLAEDPERVLRLMRENFGVKEDARDYMEQLVRGTWSHRSTIDPIIAQLSHGWEIGRMSVVDRNILRMALYEMLYLELPASIAIDEAVELAKMYSGQKAARFINGILGRVADEQEKYMAAKQQGGL